MTAKLLKQFQLYEKGGKSYCNSLQVANTSRKRHDSVLRDIRNVMSDADANFNLHNFVEIKYKDSKRREYPLYLLSKDGFMLLVMSYTGKTATQLKIDYINRFNQMELFIESLDVTRAEFPMFTRAIKAAHKNPHVFNFTNEINMIYKIVLGLSAKEYRQKHRLAADAGIKPHLTLEELKAVESLQRVDIGLIESGMKLKQRRANLIAYYERELIDTANIKAYI